jgi:hypothetical protein
VLPLSSTTILLTTAGGGSSSLNRHRLRICFGLPGAQFLRISLVSIITINASRFHHRRSFELPVTVLNIT